MNRITFLLFALAAFAGGVAYTSSTAAYAEAQAAASAPQPSKHDLKVPGGLAFSEFEGYEHWGVVAVHHTDDLIKAIVANPVAIEAYRSGIPGNGKPFPDGARLSKIEWRKGNSTTVPYPIKVPGSNYAAEIMMKDSKRFADSGGWGYAVFVPDLTTGRYKPGGADHVPPQGDNARCGAACHTIVKAQDYVFTEYGKRP